MRFSPPDASSRFSPFRGLVIVLGVGGAVALISFVGIHALRATKPQAMPLKVAPQDDPRTTRPYEAPVSPPEAELPAWALSEETLRDAVDSQALSSYPSYYLLYQASIKPPESFRDTAVPAAGPEQMKKMEPGQPVELEGEVLSVTPRTDLAFADAGIDDVHMYEIADAKDRIFLVLTVHGMSGVHAGDRVRVLGRYLQQFAHVRTGSEKTAAEAEESASVIVARAVDGSGLASNPASLKTVKDQTPYFLAKPLYHVVDLVRRTPQAVLREQADRTIPPEQLVVDPAGVRGTILRVQGGVIQTQRRSEPPNIAGVENLYRCVLRTNDGHWLWVYTLEEPRGFRKYDLVRAYGVFLKLQRYVSVTREERDAPVIIAKRLIPTRYEESADLSYMLLIIAFATIVGIGVAVVVENRRRRAVAEHVQTLSGRSRPKDLNSQLRSIAARRREEGRKALGIDGEEPTVSDRPDDAKPADATDGDASGESEPEPDDGRPAER
jgi:hypothetical protein